jgi:hypothetical protein
MGSDFLADVILDSVNIFSNRVLTFGTTTAPNQDMLFVLVGSRIDTPSRDVTINSRVTDPVFNMVTANQDLILTLGQGDLAINGNVGSAANRFGAFVVGAANDITADSAIMTDGARVVFDASGNIFMTEDGTAAAMIDTNNAITGIGGQVLLRSSMGNITVSQIVSTGGFVALTANQGAIVDAGDFLALNDIQTRRLRLEASNGIGIEVSSPVLETMVSNLEAVNTGAGRILVSNTGPLEIGDVPLTVVQSFVAGSNDTLLPNNIPLAAITGLFNMNGDIGLTNVGSLTALGGTTIATTDGTVGLFVQGDAVFAGQVRAMNNITTASDEHIFVDVTGNFTLLNGQAAADFLVDGANGKIVVTASGQVTFAPGAMAQTLGDPRIQNGMVIRREGVVLQPRPEVPMQLISTPQVSTEGVAVLTFTVGRPGEKNFQVIIDWGDGGPLEILSLDAGTHTIVHDYTEPPAANNPGAPIRVFLVVMTDPNIHFFGNEFSQPLPPDSATLIPLEPPVTGGLPRPAPADGRLGPFLFPSQAGVLSIVDFVDRAINPLNFNSPVALPNALTFINQSLNSLGSFTNPAAMFTTPFPGNLDDLGVVSVVPVFQVPATGFGGAAIIEPREVPPFFVPGNTANPLPDETEEFDDDAEELEFSGSGTDEKGQDEVIVLLQVLSPSGQKLFEYEIETKYLSNPEPLWRRLTDGRYRIVILEPGSAVPIVVRDVELRDHKVIRTFDRTRPGNEAEARREARPDDAAVSQEDFELPIPDALEDVFAPESDQDGLPVTEPSADAVWENWQPPHAGHRLSRDLADPEEATESTPETTAAFAGGLVLAALGRRSLKKADTQMTGFSKRTLSPAARLRRRLRK